MWDRGTSNTEKAEAGARIIPITGELSEGTVALALEDAKIDAPGADGFTVLVSHNAGELVKVSEVVGGPGREQLREGDRSKNRVAAAAVEVGGSKIQGIEFAQI